MRLHHTIEAIAVAILGLGATLTQPAEALPDLVSSWQAPGWAYPVVPRSAPDAGPTNVPLAAGALPGNSSSTWVSTTVRNLSATDSAPNTSQYFYLSGVLQNGLEGSLLLPNGYALYLNLAVPQAIKGGRHTLLASADPSNVVAESNELNNDWARQYVWSGLELQPDQPVVRTADPVAYAPGTGPYYNSEGFQGLAQGPSYWNVFAVMPADPSTDFDLGLSVETPSNVPLQGFGAAVAFSSYIGPSTDFVVLDRNVVAAGTYYAAVSNLGGSANKIVEFDRDQGTIGGSTIEFGPYQLQAGEIVDLHEVFLEAGVPIQIQVGRYAGDSDVTLSLFNPASGFASSLDALLTTAFYGSQPDAWLSFTPATTDFYGLVVSKTDGSSLPRSLDYTIKVTELTNLTHITLNGWYGPLVPRATPDSEVFYAPLSPTLPGNVAPTYLNWGVYNQGLVDAHNFWTGVRVDDEVAASYFVSSLSASTALALLNFETYVRGGRHHLKLQSDLYGNVAEVSEADNDFTDWFVWTPLQLASGVPVTRSAPPPSYPSGSGPYPSGDGFRSNEESPGRWSAVSVMPSAMTYEYDLRIHFPSSGSKDGFGEWIRWSDDGFPGNPDFCIVNYSIAPRVPYDHSVTNDAGTDGDFVVEQSDSSPSVLTPNVVAYGPFQLGASDILEMHEIYVDQSLVGQPVYITVNNLAGGLDLEAWLFHAYGNYFTKFLAMGGINAAGPGGDEYVPPVVFTVSGYYGLAINKSKAYDMGLAGTYEIGIWATNAVDVPDEDAVPASFAFSAPRPNPFSGQTTVELAVPAGRGHASVAVYDLQGRRVTTIARQAAPGRHVLGWDGRDARGRDVAAGVYFLRLETAGAVETRKVTLLR